MNLHGHDHENNSDHKNLIITILLNTGITIAQVMGSIFSGSVALLSDAAHNFSDVLALLISYAASRLAGRTRTRMQTYGYKRAEIFAAFINSATLLVIATIIIWEAVLRLISPKPVNGLLVIYLSALSLVFNGLSVILLRKRSQESMNIKSAYIHMFTDMMTSFAVLAGGFAIKFLGWMRIDGILSVIIAVYLVITSWGIFYKAIRIFMQFTPAGIDIVEIAREITLLKGVKNMHHVHVWQLDDREMMMEAHIDLDSDCTISHFESILEEVEAILRKYNIHHSNIQPELFRKDQKELINTGRSR